jgi:signal transduction histidine kinase
MIAAVIPHNEAERLKAVYDSELLDTDYEEDFNDIVQLASQICKVPISLITFIDENREWYKAKFGLNHTEGMRNVSFCSHAILNQDFFEIGDAQADKRFNAHPLVVSEPYIRYYGGIPLITSHGYTLGTLCVIDLVPRKISDEDLYALKVLAKQVMKLIEIRILNKKLESSLKVQNRTLAVMAHDIQNPIAAIQSAYELRQDKDLSEKDIADIEAMIPQQLTSTLSLLQNILSWGRMQLSNSTGTPTAGNLHAVCNTCFETLQVSVAEKDNQLINDIPDYLSAPYADEALEFILRNLLVNACKFTAGGTINVSAYRVKSVLKISVTDTGVGMSSDKLQLLENTRCGDNTKGTNNEKGSGLGLMLIYEFLAGVRGELSITSEIGKGTNCTITLPC